MDEQRIIDLERELIDTRNAAVVLILQLLHQAVPADSDFHALADEMESAAQHATSPAEARIARMAAACLRSDWRPS